MFFNILGNIEQVLRPPVRRRAAPCPVRDASCPGNTCGSAALHALPRAAARCGARHRGGGNFRGDRLPGLPMTSRDDSLLASSCWTFGRSG